MNQPKRNNSTYSHQTTITMEPTPMNNISNDNTNITKKSPPLFASDSTATAEPSLSLSTGYASRNHNNSVKSLNQSFSNITLESKPVGVQFQLSEAERNISWTAGLAIIEAAKRLGPHVDLVEYAKSPEYKAMLALKDPPGQFTMPKPTSVTYTGSSVIKTYNMPSGTVPSTPDPVIDSDRDRRRIGSEIRDIIMKRIPDEDINRYSSIQILRQAMAFESILFVNRQTNRHYLDLNTLEMRVLCVGRKMASNSRTYGRSILPKLTVHFNMEMKCTHSSCPNSSMRKFDTGRFTV